MINARQLTAIAFNNFCFLFSYTDGKTIILNYWVVRVSKNIERVLRLQSFETTYICMPHVNSTS